MEEEAIPLQEERCHGRARALIVFARLPVPGKVKTRLAAGVGSSAACDFYKACAEHVMEEAARCDDVRRYLFFADGNDESDIAKWMQEIGQSQSFILKAQRGGADLGERMMTAFNEVFHEGAVQAVIIGTDCPDLSAHIIMTAFSTLSHNEVVFGPAYDGGYYLLGLVQVHRILFEGIPWSTTEVLRLSALGALQAQLMVAPLNSLTKLRDIDTVQDLQAWLHSPDFLLRRSPSLSRTLKRIRSWNSLKEGGESASDLKSKSSRQFLRRVAERICEEKRLLDDALAETGYLI